MDRWNNKLFKDVHYSRLIASYINVGGDSHDIEVFRGWLMHLGLNEQEAWDVYNLATCGKLEIESDALKWLKRNKLSYVEPNRARLRTIKLNRIKLRQ